MLRLDRSSEELRDRFFTLTNPEDVADFLEVRYSDLIYYLYRVPKEQQYTTFYIPKKSGRSRQILTPTSSLKIIQFKLNQVLQSVYQPKPSVHGFIHGRSIVTNAEAHMQHKKRRYILNIDLEDFFPSINFGRVRGMFMANPYHQPEKVATILAQICCVANMLPQGAPTSPVVSNMICSKMDTQLQHLARETNSFYTRYVDDISFSTSLPNLPKSLAVIRKQETGEILEVGKHLRHIVEKNGFRLNPDKVRLHTPERRQEITGLTVNKFPNVPRRFVNQIRAMLHAWEKYGLEKAEEEHQRIYRQKHRWEGKGEPSYTEIVKGKIEFLGMVRGSHNPKYRRFLEKLQELDPNFRMKPMPKSVPKIFISYSHDDADWLQKLQRHLVPLVDNRIIAPWDDTKIEDGTKWRKEIEVALSEADAAILLVSKNFLSSKFIKDQELPPLLRSAEKRGLAIFWILVGDCVWDITAISQFKTSYNINQPLNTLNEGDADRALANFCRAILTILQ